MALQSFTLPSGLEPCSQSCQQGTGVALPLLPRDSTAAALGQGWAPAPAPFLGTGDSQGKMPEPSGGHAQGGDNSHGHCPGLGRGIGKHFSLLLCRGEIQILHNPG